MGAGRIWYVCWEMYGRKEEVLKGWVVGENYATMRNVSQSNKGCRVETKKKRGGAGLPPPPPSPPPPSPCTGSLRLLSVSIKGDRNVVITGIWKPCQTPHRIKFFLENLYYIKKKVKQDQEARYGFTQYWSHFKWTDQHSGTKYCRLHLSVYTSGENMF